ncbi:MAG: hypothetical protein BGO98_40635 [Myxococcales bacterium 68-20]|nr:MAG: hypothetical protein BGO98_40635 [Myxococcales bacterium 68-20]
MRTSVGKDGARALGIMHIGRWLRYRRTQRRHDEAAAAAPDRDGEPRALERQRRLLGEDEAWVWETQDSGSERQLHRAEALDAGHRPMLVRSGKLFRTCSTGEASAITSPASLPMRFP